MKYLEHKEFIAKYNELWTGAGRQFFKLETLPEYDEFDINDWGNVGSKQTQQLINRVQGEIYSCKADYEEKIKIQGMEFLRIRYLQFPLSKYLLIELSSYATSELIGAKIEIVEELERNQLRETLIPYFHDFLLFDDKAILKIDNPGGICKCGAYFSEDPIEIAPYIELKNEISKLSQPLKAYMEQINLNFISPLPNGTNT